MSDFVFFFTLYKLFSAFIKANNTGSLINSLFGVKILIHAVSFCLSNFDLSVAVSCGGTNSSSVFDFSSLLNSKE